jgi:hypothetical protein
MTSKFQIKEVDFLKIYKSSIRLSGNPINIKTPVKFTEALICLKSYKHLSNNACILCDNRLIHIVGDVKDFKYEEVKCTICTNLFCHRHLQTVEDFNLCSYSLTDAIKNRGIVKTHEMRCYLYTLEYVVTNFNPLTILKFSNMIYDIVGCYSKRFMQCTRILTEDWELLILMYLHFKSKKEDHIFMNYIRHTDHNVFTRYKDWVANMLLQKSIIAKDIIDNKDAIDTNDTIDNKDTIDTSSNLYYEEDITDEEKALIFPKVILRAKYDLYSHYANMVHLYNTYRHLQNVTNFSKLLIQESIVYNNIEDIVYRLNNVYEG